MKNFFRLLIEMFIIRAKLYQSRISVRYFSSVLFICVSHSHCRFCVSFAAGIRKRKSCGKAIEKSGIGFQTRDPIFFHINIIIIEKWRKEKCKETLNSTGIDSHQRI